MSITDPTHAVLIVAHGERGGRCNNARLMELADEVRDRLGDIEVVAGVLRGTPSIADAWASLKAPNRFIYPFFMADGYFCNRILPKKVSEAIGEEDAPFTMLPPFGVSDDLADGVARALLAEIDQLGRSGTKPPILIAAHGASIDKQSSTRARELAAQLDQTGQFGPITCGFLDEAPHLEDMISSIEPGSLVLPHFNGLGSHSVDDMAELSSKAPEGCHFVTPVGGQSWVGKVMTADIEKALRWSEIAEAAE
ncbi:CbiX/SirB N-terminal domain-containing protein [uncultured Cohaesibacter sp.]|uniref:sirohydrochlorin chelatase n=1 Tax=uncultured Cohaesibacter sp. TaxID=1002546 RepID=UPI0029C923D8|nr:CbiX/SirB N-terminal domain-containing protein [uncultured Cohaesibacter sp.]